MNTKTKRMATALGIGLTLALAWQAALLVLGPTASAADCPVPRGVEGPVPRAVEGTTRYVAPDGDDASDCASIADRCRSIQRAVDAAQTGDQILVASGTYTGVRNVRSLNTAVYSSTQVVVITKTVTLRGGYTTSDWVTYDPDANPTTVDAEGKGRALAIVGTQITPTVEGLRITGGDATGLGSGLSGDAAGGGVYALGASPTISDCMVFSNTASRESRGYGGGLFVAGDASLTAITVEGNSASLAANGFGGGISLHYSEGVLENSTIQGNTASSGAAGYGGGVYVYGLGPTLRANVVQSNTGSIDGTGRGGGVCLHTTENATLNSNIVRDNLASRDGTGYGGGVMLMSSSYATLGVNRIEANRGSTAALGFGGGLRSQDSPNLALISNVVHGNAASTAETGHGGGVSLDSSEDTTLSGNTVVSNSATLEPAASGYGGGLHIRVGGPFTMTNNLVAANHANSEGSGAHFEGWSGGRLFGSLIHTTVADNLREGGGDGLYLGRYTTLALTNTILAGHGSVGLRVQGDSSATLEATLWWANGVDTGGAGTVVTGTLNVYGDPAFVGPAAHDYHISGNSAAIDAGIDADVRVDIDGDPRPAGVPPDIGADEFEAYRIYLPLVVRD